MSVFSPHPKRAVAANSRFALLQPLASDDTTKRTGSSEMSTPLSACYEALVAAMLREDTVVHTPYARDAAGEKHTIYGSS